MAERPDGAGDLSRVPALDGMRTLAVYLVVAFHAGVSRLAGGFIGVDVFFVLSGFLITRLLLVEQLGSGRLGLVRFYARRARRLLPAAWLMIVVTTIGYALLATPLERTRMVGDARASALYVANWRFIRQGQDYFADSLDSSPFLHLWSLAVEEQFYIVWPLISIVLMVLWRISPGLVRMLLGVGTGAGAALAMSTGESDLLRAYYGTDMRAYQLMAGAFVAAALLDRDGAVRRPLPIGLADVLTAVGVIGIIAAAVIRPEMDPVDRGVIATCAAVVAIIGLVARIAAGRVDSLLGWRPFERLGVLSYGTYLWHWPIIVLLERVVEIRPRNLVVIVAVLATGCAWASHVLVEAPIARWARRDRSVGRRDRSRMNVASVGVGLVASALIGLVAVPVILRSSLPTLSVSTRLNTDAEMIGEPVPDDLTGADARSTLLDATGCVNIVPESVEQCIVVDGGGQRILLIGDSHASKLRIGLAEFAAANDMALAVASMNGCPWLDDVLYRDALPVDDAKQACRDQTAAVYDWLPNGFDADVVVAVNHDLVQEDYSVVPSADSLFADDLVGLDLVDAAVARSLDVLLDNGRRVVIVEPIPTAPFDPPSCLSAADTSGQCDFVVDLWPPADTLLYREIAVANPRVSTADITSLACPQFPRCASVADGVVVREDIDHLAPAYVERLADELAAQLGL